jgi:hypothetical protein
MKIDMADVGGGAVLAGALAGKEALGDLVRRSPGKGTSPLLVFLDFAHIDVATASYIRESVLAFRDLLRGQRSNLYPLLANLNDVVLDEFVELLRARGDAMPSCRLDEHDIASNIEVLGDLDPKQKLTFDLVRQRRETGAGELMRDFGDAEGVKHATAWNNRLSALVARGLIVELSHGRAKRYRPLLSEV